MSTRACELLWCRRPARAPEALLCDHHHGRLPTALRADLERIDPRTVLDLPANLDTVGRLEVLAQARAWELLAEIERESVVNPYRPACQRMRVYLSHQELTPCS